MNRRDLLKQMSLASAALLMPSARVFAAPEDYTGRFFITLQAAGAWDVSSFCDPKANQSGEPEINTWSRSESIQTAGNIAYAPFGNNAAFFDAYYQDMMVINGIDAQTNSHTTGVLHNWSGRNSGNYPSLTALFSAANAPELPLAYLNFGGYSETANLVRYTRLDDINALLSVLRPNVTPWNEDNRYRSDARLQQVLAAQQARLQRLRAENSRLPRQQYAMDAYYQARENNQGLEDFAAVIPASDQRQTRVQANTNVSSNLLEQIQISLLAMQSGVACSADLICHGFDTHADHDELHGPLLGHLTDAIDYLWTYADQQGIADRITLLIASDFSRTPFYNSSNGKDHWPIGSAVVMERNAAWGNRVVGATDEAQNAYAINPTTLARDDANGSIIYPHHVHEAMRRYLGLDLESVTSPFAFNNSESFDLFNPSLST